MPLLFELPLHIKDTGFKPGIKIWQQDITENPFKGPLILFQNNQIKEPWLWLQPAVGALILGVFTVGRHFMGRNKKKLDGPEPAGSGQFGSSRWQTQSEVDTNFTKWTLRGD